MRGYCADARLARLELLVLDEERRLQSESEALVRQQLAGDPVRLFLHMEDTNRMRLLPLRYSPCAPNDVCPLLRLLHHSQPQLHL